MSTYSIHICRSKAGHRKPLITISSEADLDISSLSVCLLGSKKSEFEQCYSASLKSSDKLFLNLFAADQEEPIRVLVDEQAEKLPLDPNMHITFDDDRSVTATAGVEDTLQFVLRVHGLSGRYHILVESISVKENGYSTGYSFLDEELNGISNITVNLPAKN